MFKLNTTTIVNTKQAWNSEYIHTLIHSSFNICCRSTFSSSSKIHNAPPNNLTFLTQPWLCQMQVNPHCLHLHCNDHGIVLIIRTTTPLSSSVGAFGIQGLQCHCFLDLCLFNLGIPNICNNFGIISMMLHAAQGLPWLNDCAWWVSACVLLALQLVSSLFG